MAFSSFYDVVLALIMWLRCFSKKLVHFLWACYVLCNLAFWHVVNVGLASRYSYCFWRAYNNTWNAFIRFVALNVHSFTPNQTMWSLLVMDEVSLNSVILYPFSSPVRSSLPSAYVFEKWSFVNRANTQHCIVKIQFNIVSIAASQYVVFMPHPAVFLILVHNSVLRCFRRPLFLSF